MLQLLKELHWLPVNQRIVFELLMIVYKCINNITPSSLNSSHNIHQGVRFVPETSNFFKKRNQIAAGETDHLQLQLLDFGMNYLLI